MQHCRRESATCNCWYSENFDTSTSTSSDRSLSLHQAPASALSVFDTPDLLSLVATYADAASSVANLRGTNLKWPAPEGQKFDGAVQCIPCPFLNCRSFQKSERAMTQHMDRHHDDQPRAQHMHFHQNEWCFNVSRTFWCFPTGFNRTYELATQETHDKYWAWTRAEAQTHVVPTLSAKPKRQQRSAFAQCFALIDIPHTCA